MSDWKQRFKRDVVQAAIPDWTLYDDDVITLRFSDWDDYDPTYGGGDQEWISMEVNVRRFLGPEQTVHINSNDAKKMAAFLQRLLG